MDLIIRIADKDVDRVIDQAADTFGYVHLVIDKVAVTKIDFVLDQLKKSLFEAAKSKEVFLNLDVVKKNAEDKFDNEVVIETVKPVVAIEESPIK